MSRRLFLGLALAATVTPAAAHVAERALVLLLPTDVYIAAGVAAVVATVALTVLAPAALFRRFAARRPEGEAPGRAALATSCGSFVVLSALVVLGLFGPRDPLANLLPLVLLTLWWICLPVAQALFGDLWAWLDPWRGPLALLGVGRRLWEMPAWLVVWPAVASYVLAGLYALADPAPDDPARLAVAVAGYWLFTFAMCLLFGADWLRRGEGLTLFLTLVARLAPLRRTLALPVPLSGSLAVFCVTALAVGSFDGLNESFWWLGLIDVNPLAFPGRTALIGTNVGGLLAAALALNLVFAACVYAGLRLAGHTDAFADLWPRLALSLIAIALGYHLAHLLTAALVNLQYLVAAANDPLAQGAAWLGITEFHVTTSFFNQRHTVQAIWLVQAAAIVGAHMLAVLLAHAVALRGLGNRRAALLSQAPVAAFMVLYTLFGLWLLSTPVAL